MQIRLSQKRRDESIGRRYRSAFLAQPAGLYGWTKFVDHGASLLECFTCLAQWAVAQKSN